MPITNTFHRTRAGDDLSIMHGDKYLQLSITNDRQHADAKLTPSDALVLVNKLLAFVQLSTPE